MAWLNRETARSTRIFSKLVSVNVSIKSQFPCRVTHTSICSTAIWQKTWQLTVTSYHFSSWQTQSSDTLRNYPILYLRGHAPPKPKSVTRSRRSRPLKSCLSCYYHSADWANSPTNCDPVEWKSGEQGNVNRVQLGFCTVFVSCQQIMQNPHPR